MQEYFQPNIGRKIRKFSLILQNFWKLKLELVADIKVAE